MTSSDWSEVEVSGSLATAWAGRDAVNYLRHGHNSTTDYASAPKHVLERPRRSSSETIVVDHQLVQEN